MADREFVTGAVFVAGARDNVKFDLENLADATMEEILEDYQLISYLYL